MKTPMVLIAGCVPCIARVYGLQQSIALVSEPPVMTEEMIRVLTIKPPKYEYDDLAPYHFKRGRDENLPWYANMGKNRRKKN